MTLGTFLTPPGLLALLAWNFMVLSAVQLTIRLIMRFSVRETVIAAVALTVLSLPAAFVFDLLTGPDPGFATRLAWVPVPMLLMAVAGYAVARWSLHIKRTRGRVVAAGMIGLLAPHLFTLAASLI